MSVVFSSARPRSKGEVTQQSIQKVGTDGGRQGGRGEREGEVVLMLPLSGRTLK